MATHCISHALYNPTDPDMENMSETYDNSRSVETVLSWMAYLIRGVKQNELKQHAVSMLDEINGLRLSDLAQKIIPVSFGEGQN